MNKTRFYIFLIATLTSVQLFSQTDQELLNDLFSKLRQSFVQGDFEKTLELYDNIQGISSIYPNEITRISIKACDELLNSSAFIGSKESISDKKRMLKNILALQEEQKGIQKERSNIPLQEVKTNYNQNALYSNGMRFIKNGKKLKYQEVLRLLSTYPESELELELYQKKSRTGTYLFLGTLACYTAALLIDQNNESLATGLGVTGFALNIAALPFMIKGNGHFSKSVWHYNRESAINPN